MSSILCTVMEVRESNGGKFQVDAIVVFNHIGEVFAIVRMRYLCYI